MPPHNVIDGEVLIVVSSATRRGAEVQGTTLAHELSARGVAARAIALAPASSGKALPIPVLGRSPLSRGTLASLRSMARGASAVVGYGSSSLPACSIALVGTRVPFVYQSIGDPGQWVRGPWHRRRTGIMFRRADFVSTLWPGATSAIEDLYGVPRSRMCEIPNARSSSSFTIPSAGERERARRDLGVAGTGPVAVFVGSLNEEKRPDLAIRTMEFLPDAVLLVAGDGPLRTDLTTLGSAFNGRVRLLGSLEDVRPLLRSADVHISTSRTEGMPGALIEAALMGVPSVATDVGGVAVTLGPGGRLVPVESASNVVAAAVRRVLDDRMRLGELAREHAAARFTWDVVVPQWIELFRLLAGYTESGRW